MKNKKSLTESILTNIGNKSIMPLESRKDNNEVKLDLNSFIMVPINHPKINEIIELLNRNESILNINKINTNTENYMKSKDTIHNSENNTRLIITLNDILNKYNQHKIMIPKDSIITPLARDYIKQKKIEVIFTK